MAPGVLIPGSFFKDEDDSSSSPEIIISTKAMENLSMAEPSLPLTRIPEAHMKLLHSEAKNDTVNELLTTPIFIDAVRAYADEVAKQNLHEMPFSQYGLIAGDINGQPQSDPQWGLYSDPRIFYNMAAPSSVFICGSQGSGKSHSLGCLLENSLVNFDGNKLPHPLTGLIFHYDTFTSENAGSPCEAAFISSNKGVSVRVLCAPTNIGQIRRIYSKLPQVQIEELRINETDLNTSRMLELMAVSSIHGAMPLYFSVINRILRELRIEQQLSNTPFDYGRFKMKLDQVTLTDGQLAPLQQRLETLESFMVQKQAFAYDLFKTKVKSNKTLKTKGNDWTPKARQLTIVDLSCPCVTAGMACSLFGICLSLFLEQNSNIGKIVALDEAHKFMTDSAECQALTESLLSTIRLQRHLGTRIVISTQEPTISPRLLDLCSVTIVHRFTSPDWLATLKKHLAGASPRVENAETNRHDSQGTLSINESKSIVAALVGAKPLSPKTSDVASGLFAEIVALHTGEALLFAPSAIIGVKKGTATKTQQEEVSETSAEDVLVRLGHGILKVRIRNRVTEDGGRSVMAT